MLHTKLFQCEKYYLLKLFRIRFVKMCQNLHDKILFCWKSISYIELNKIKYGVKQKIKWEIHLTNPNLHESYETNIPKSIEVNIVFV